MKAKHLALFLGLFLLILGVGSRSRVIAAGPSGTSPDAASIKGVVKFAGQAPHPTPIRMTSEPSCSKLHSGPVMSEDVVVGQDGGLENVIVFVSQGLEGRHFDPPAEPATIEQKGCVYKPHVLAVQANQKLRIVNEDGTLHNIHPTPSNNREWNKAQPPNAPPLEEVFPREEVSIPVKCNVHSWMKGYLAVFSHPYFAVTGGGGSFDLKALPPGNYTITAWHEKLGTETQHITVGGNETKSLEFVFKSNMALR